MQHGRWAWRFLSVLLLALSGIFAGNQLYGDISQHACTNTNCNGFSKSGVCPGSAVCNSTDTSSNFYACLPSAPDNCRTRAGSTNCPGTCTDPMSTACTITIGWCLPY
jgi:hypothetical protein